MMSTFKSYLQNLDYAYSIAVQELGIILNAIVCF